VRIYLDDGTEVAIGPDSLRITNPANKTEFVIDGREHNPIPGARRINALIKALSFLLDVAKT